MLNLQDLISEMVASIKVINIGLIAVAITFILTYAEHMH